MCRSRLRWCRLRRVPVRLAPNRLPKRASALSLLPWPTRFATPPASELPSCRSRQKKFATDCCATKGSEMVTFLTARRSNGGGFMKWFAASFLSLFIAIGSLQGAEAPKYGGRLVFGLSRDISGLNPFFRTRSTNKYVRQIAYETLFDYDDKERLVPLLGEAWTASPDSKVYTIQLRREVKFHNGADLTAEDVKWSAEFAMDPKNAATGVNFLSKVQAVNIKDKYTVEFVLKEPNAIFINLLASIEASFPVLPKDSLSSGQREPSSPPAGTGPFEFKEYKSAREM